MLLQLIFLYSHLSHYSMGYFLHCFLFNLLFIFHNTCIDTTLLAILLFCVKIKTYCNVFKSQSVGLFHYFHFKCWPLKSIYANFVIVTNIHQCSCLSFIQEPSHYLPCNLLLFHKCVMIDLSEILIPLQRFVERKGRSFEKNVVQKYRSIVQEVRMLFLTLSLPSSLFPAHD